MLIFDVMFTCEGESCSIRLGARDELHALLVFEFLFGFGADGAKGVIN